MALQVSQYPYLEAASQATSRAVGQTGPEYAWHIDKNVSEPVALAMLPALTGPITQRGLLLLVCDATISASPIKAFAAAAAAQSILRNYYYKTESSNHSHMLFQAILEGIREANDAIAHQFWPNADELGSLTVTDNLAGISVTAVVAHHNKLVIGSVGDIQAYRLRKGKLSPYEQGEQEHLIVLEDDFRKGDRVFVCTQALVAANGIGRIRAAVKVSNEAAPAAIRTLMEAAAQTELSMQTPSAQMPMDIAAVGMLYRNSGAPALPGPGRTLAVVPVAPPRVLQPAPQGTSPLIRWISLACIALVVAVVGWLLYEQQRNRLAITLNTTALATPIEQMAQVAQAPLATSLMPVPVLDNNRQPDLANSGNLSVVIATSEAGIVVFRLAATETPVVPTPAPPPTNTATPEPTPTVTVALSRTALSVPTVAQTRPVVPATVAAPQPISPPPQPTSPPPQPTARPPQPTSPPPQPTSPPPQPTSPPPQPTSPPPQPTSPPPQPTSPPPPPDLSVPCLPGDAQCKP